MDNSIFAIIIAVIIGLIASFVVHFVGAFLMVPGELIKLCDILIFLYTAWKIITILKRTPPQP